MKTEILHEDKDILVIYKPAGLATQTAKIGQQDVVSELKNYLSRTQANPYVGVIHRLDQPVEGLLVFAKNKKAAADLTAQLQKQGEGGLHKHYYAVVCGKPSGQEGELVDYMYKSADNRAVIVEGVQSDEKQPTKAKAGAPQSGSTREPTKAKKAELRYCIVGEAEITDYQALQKQTAARGSDRENESKQTVQKQITSGGIFRVDIHILTGRFHQIRAQMSHAGLPLLGDIKYGNEETCTVSKQLGIQNVALCAYRLEFIHPVTKKKMQFETEPKGKAFSLFSHT